MSASLASTAILICVLFFFLAQNVSARRSRDRDDKESGNSAGLASSQMVKKPYEFASATGKNVLRIKDTAANKWALRVDQAHKTGATWDHINVNPKVSGMADPHTPISKLTLHGAKTANKVAGALQTAGTVVMYGAIAYDAASVVNTAVNEGAEKAVKEAGKKATGYAAGYAGGYVGGMAGAKLGGLVGSVLGPAGTVAGGTIGGIAGSIYGAFQGAGAAAFFTG